MVDQPIMAMGIGPLYSISSGLRQTERERDRESERERDRERETERERKGEERREGDNTR